MGLRGLSTCSFQTLEIMKNCDSIFIEPYTNFVESEIPPLYKQFIEKFIYLKREDLEELSDRFLDKLEGTTAALLIPGDPFVATTHVSLRIAAIQRGYHVKIIHNSSIISAAISASGLSSYRFGRSVTCPFSDNPSEVPYRVIQKNKSIDAHTLVLLDINILKNIFLSIDEAIAVLRGLEETISENIITEKDIVMGLAHIGYDHEFICVGNPEQVKKKYNWKEIGPPQALIVCADSLHFEEQEVLNRIWEKKTTR